MTPEQIELILLKELKKAPGECLTPEPSLSSFVNLMADEPLTLTEFRTTLQTLENNRQVVSVRHEGILKWKITANGRARLAENA